MVYVSMDDLIVNMVASAVPRAKSQRPVAAQRHPTFLRELACCACLWITRSCVWLRGLGPASFLSGLWLLSGIPHYYVSLHVEFVYLHG